MRFIRICLPINQFCCGMTMNSIVHLILRIHKRGGNIDLFNRTYALTHEFHGPTQQTVKYLQL